MSNEILVAVDTFQTTVDGQEVRIAAGKTTVRAGHPLLDGLGDSFVPLVPTFDVVKAAPEAVPAPPAPVPAKKAAAKSETR